MRSLPTTNISLIGGIDFEHVGKEYFKARRTLRRATIFMPAVCVAIIELKTKYKVSKNALVKLIAERN